MGGLSIAAATVFLAALAGAGIGRRFVDRQAFAAPANALAGGFLLGASLFHFMPESHELFDQIYPDHKFPVDFALIALGFTLILWLERLVLDPGAHELDKGKASGAKVMAIALGGHSLLTGIAVGAEHNPSGLMSIVVALCAHKLAGAFTLSSGMNRANATPNQFITTILIFALATPFGIGIGSSGQLFLSIDQQLMIQAVFSALAAGTFLYIAALDVVHDEFFNRHANWRDLTFFVLGLVVMLALTLTE